MAVTLNLTDSEGRLWDLSGVNPIGTAFPSQTGQGVINGSLDAYDGGLALAVNGRLYDTNISSLGVNGRELNLAPVIMNSGTVAVTRSFLVSDAAISAVGFMRVLDSFTNITNVRQTITVEFLTDVGSDNATAVVSDTNGSNTITISDFGYVTDEAANQTGGDSSVGFAYGDGRGLAPVAAGQALFPGTGVDEIAVRYSITLAPGETRSLLSFGFQNTTTAQGAADLPFFTRSLQALDADNFLAGISAAERATIVNYTEGLRGRPDFVLTDGGGTQWGVDVSSRTLATIGSSALREGSFNNGNFGPSFGNLASSGLGEEGREASFRYTPSIAGLGPSSVDYSYFAAPDRNWVRQLVTYNGAPGIVFNTPADGLFVQTGASLVNDISQATLIGNGAVALDDRAWIFDDSASGADGTSPALGVVVGNFQFNSGIAQNANDRAVFSSGQLEVERQQILTGTQSFLFFFASNETAGPTFAATAPLLTPGFRELAGMSDAEVTSIRNFTLTSADRLDEQVGTAGNDVFTGNYWGDQIDGAGGDDLIIGGGSDDVLSGGAGIDTIAGGVGNDVINGGSEDDRLFGDADNDSLTGGTGNDYLSGGTGNDALDGGIGADIMEGNGGDDSYSVDNGGDIVNEGGGQGNDRILTTVTYRLPTASEVELLSAANQLGTTAMDLGGSNTGQALIGNDGVNNIDGLGGVDSLFGLGGDDVLDGGTGGDQMFGGTGNDWFIVDGTGDAVFENVGEGFDRVLATGTWRLSNNAEIELIATLSQTGTTAIDLAGNDVSQTIIGNDGSNSLEGGGGVDTLFGLGGADQLDGGTGADQMVGGTGDDVYGIENVNDAIFENAGEGNDRALVTVSYRLSSSAEVELLAVANASGTTAIDIAGNGFAQTLIGNQGANFLEGLGGNDTLFGEGGNDTLDGGLGADNLVGGTGGDRFAFSTTLGGDNFDRIFDFAGGAGGDRIQLHRSVFTALGLGTLTGGQFVAGTAALDADDRILYDQASGTIFYDADGNGSGAAVAFAQLNAGTTLVASDFIVV